MGFFRKRWVAKINRGLEIQGRAMYEKYSNLMSHTLEKIEKYKKVLRELNNEENIIKTEDVDERGYGLKVCDLKSGNKIIKISDWDNEKVKILSPDCLASDIVDFVEWNLKIVDSDKYIVEDEAIRESQSNLFKKIEEVAIIAKALDLENICLDINEVDEIISKDILQKYFQYETKTQYLANKEKALRKNEGERLLAKSYTQRQSQSELRKNLASIDNLINISPIEFEKWVRENVFEKEGWVVEETKNTGDGGVDLVLYKGDEKSIAQCKRFRGTVGEPMIRDFYGAMFHEGVSRGFFITTGLYSIPALKFSEDKPIEMIDRRILANKYL